MNILGDRLETSGVGWSIGGGGGKKMSAYVLTCISQVSAHRIHDDNAKQAQVQWQTTAAEGNLMQHSCSITIHLVLARASSTSSLPAATAVRGAAGVVVPRTLVVLIGCRALAGWGIRALGRYGPGFCPAAANYQHTGYTMMLPS